MGDDIRRMRHPPWVKIGLWGLAGRAAAWAFVWLSVAIAIGCVAYRSIGHRSCPGRLMVVAASWYKLSIRWVDEHGDWARGPV
jgi:hypothetical protein